MQEPKGEKVGLDLYFGQSSRVDAFARVVRYCCKHGGSFAGSVLQSEGFRARDHRYMSIADRPVRQLRINADELERKLDDKDTDVIKVAIWSAIGAIEKVPEIITYCGTSSDASRVDNPPIAILTEGWMFSTPGYEGKAKKAGQRCYEKLIGICNSLDPDYAAILNEDSLPCSFDLAFGAGERCFVNFFVSERAYRSSTIASIETLYKDAYIERLATGIYVSNWSMYNPGSVTMEGSTALKRSALVARMLGRREGSIKHV